MENVFAYLRVSTKNQKTDSQLLDIKAAYPDLLQDNIHVDFGVSGTVPAMERPECKTLLSKLRKGDVLVVWWIDRLGRDFDDVTKTLRYLIRERGITIKTVNGKKTFSDDKEHRVMTDIMITLYADQAESERANRLASAESGRKALLEVDETTGERTKKGDVWKSKFKGRRPNSGNSAGLHDKIRDALSRGLSVRKTANEVGCSTATVQKVKKQIESK
ncbi:recombinase family protein [Vibrio vulnificus]|nr:recombinase family protein [Vibrio vulnificus]